MSVQAGFLDVVLADPTVAAVLERAPALAVPDWWITPGVLFQAVRNDLTLPRDDGARAA